MSKGHGDGHGQAYEYACVCFATGLSQFFVTTLLQLPHRVPPLVWFICSAQLQVAYEGVRGMNVLLYTYLFIKRLRTFPHAYKTASSLTIIATTTTYLTNVA
ncbi:hypothetical protein, unlikely [Trypanosoma brucei gambiense DAL972]|uniref:Uncharacterized protein n=1 Tax=Trypanosoma brucei gambiense (strain MHOM/CI/86/DAL972) TaxID=679716 RepID=C9ZU68_TRYB9|nr:hypothetical protein, unlikely [Trypanosoma brucei gambiense DAL972]CBH12954.1 hypothetical protein, unlikely [Trypanosoma brucei gambiense DAL972]|eukprot:XP_011775233.1 hypothetical protein, unlikely [Trypanosoma brucei gambiense DAL972]